MITWYIKRHISAITEYFRWAPLTKNIEWQNQRKNVYI